MQIPFSFRLAIGERRKLACHGVKLPHAIGQICVTNRRQCP
jgi:hypothetical protein